MRNDGFHCVRVEMEENERGAISRLQTEACYGGYNKKDDEIRKDSVDAAK